MHNRRVTPRSRSRGETKAQGAARGRNPDFVASVASPASGGGEVTGAVDDGAAVKMGKAKRTAEGRRGQMGGIVGGGLPAHQSIGQMTTGCHASPGQPLMAILSGEQKGWGG